MWAQSLQCMNLVAPWLSFLTRDQTCVPCIGSQILNHWTIRETPELLRLLNETVLAKVWQTVLWPPDTKSRLIEKTLMLGKIEGRRRRGKTEDEMVGWQDRLNGH